MVVPYVNMIEKPKESFVENADKNMTDVITDSNISDDLKMKIYHQNLSKFLLKYDPETYGVTPALVELARTVSEFVDKNNKEQIKADAQIKIEPKDTPKVSPIKIKKREQSSKKKLEFENATPLIANDYNMNNDYYKITDSSINKGDYSKLELSPNNTLLKNFEANIEPSKNTRQNKKEATHHQGLYGDHLINERNITQRKSTLIPRTPVHNQILGNGNAGESKRKWETKNFF